MLSDKQEAGARFKDYFDWSEPSATVPSHRLLAMRRGEEEGVLMMRISPPEEDALSLLEPYVVKGPGKSGTEQIRLAVQDSSNGCSAPPSRLRCGSSPGGRPTPKRSGVFAETSASSCWRRPSAARTCWPSTLDSAPVAGASAWIATAKLLHEDVIYPTLVIYRFRQGGRRGVRFARSFRLRPSPSAMRTASGETETFVRA